MKTLVVMNEKGGVGKTNIVAHAAWYFGERLRTLVIDLDQQGNLSATLSGHLAKETAVSLFSPGGRIKPVGDITVAGATRDLSEVEQTSETDGLLAFRDNLAAMAGDYDVCVIDTPPALANRTYAALLASDAVLAPVGVNDYSIAGVANLMQAIKGISEYFERTPPLFLGLIPSIFDRRSVRERELFVALAEGVGQLLFPGIVAKRDVYARAAGEGTPVWRLPPSAAVSAARDEIQGVFAEVAKKMGVGRDD